MMFGRCNWTATRALGHQQVYRICLRFGSSGSEGTKAKLSTSDSSRLQFILWDSMSKTMKEIPCRTGDNKALAWYTCGPTTYAAMHLGHARTYVWFDMMRRVLQFVCSGQGAPPPLFVMNITDVDDKILAAAKDLADDDVCSSPVALARRAEAEFWKDMDALGCLRPHVVTRVTEHVDSDIIPYIQQLEKNGVTYMAGDGLYFDVQAFELKFGSTTHYGKLSNLSTSGSDTWEEAFQNTARDKRDRRDFALWKSRKEGETLYWTSPWGDGRPGWHIECSAMIESIQRQFEKTHTFMVHGGGVDLKFPHHCNEIAQAEAFHCDCSKKEWIPHWVHTGHLMIKDSKMSKSLKNFLTVEELWFDQAANPSKLDSPSDDFRLWCLMGGDYGHKEEYSREKIILARKKREKFLRFLVDGESWLKRWDQGNVGDEKRWDEKGLDLFHLTNDNYLRAIQAILHNMKGTDYLEAIQRIADEGNSCIRQNEPKASLVEPVKAAIDTTRNLLLLVGFSDVTVRAGMNESEGDHKSNSTVGGEEGIIDELLRFREGVRRATLADVKAKNATQNSKELLRLCDEIRDSTLPAMGVEVMDHGKDKSTWRFCIPKDLGNSKR